MNLLRVMAFTNMIIKMVIAAAARPIDPMTLPRSPNVAFTTPDKSVVAKTNDNHPAAQCRLDTYYNGILCDKSYDIDVDDKNPVTGVCVKKDGYTYGARPLCWYKPSANE